MAVAAAAKPSKKAEPAELENIKRDFVRAYQEHIDDAMASVQLTETETWQRLIQEHRQQLERARTGMAFKLRSLADTVERQHLSEDDAKALKGVKDQDAAMQSQSNTFRQKTIDPVRRPIDGLRAAFERARSKASSAQTHSPLINDGLVVLVGEYLSGFESVRWIEDEHRAVVVPAGAGDDAGNGDDD